MLVKIFQIKTPATTVMVTAAVTHPHHSMRMRIIRPLHHHQETLVGHHLEMVQETVDPADQADHLHLNPTHRTTQILKTGPHVHDFGTFCLTFGIYANVPLSLLLSTPCDNRRSMIMLS
jgi:hypothetical protein